MMLFWLRKYYVTSILILQLINFHILAQKSKENSLLMNLKADAEQECANLEDIADDIDVDEEKAA